MQRGAFKKKLQDKYCSFQRGAFLKKLQGKYCSFLREEPKKTKKGSCLKRAILPWSFLRLLFEKSNTYPEVKKRLLFEKSNVYPDFFFKTSFVRVLPLSILSVLTPAGEQIKKTKQIQKYGLGPQKWVSPRDSHEILSLMWFFRENP